MLCAREGCAEPIEGRRSDARYCSRRCSGVTRVRAYAKRNREAPRGAWRRYYYTPKGTVTALLSNAQDRAKRSKVPFQLSREWLMARIEAGVCEVTGINLVRAPRGASRAHPFAPSIDRVVPSLGYTETNCRVVCFIFNQARSDFGDETLLIMARALVESAR